METALSVQVPEPPRNEVLRPVVSRVRGAKIKVEARAVQTLLGVFDVSSLRMEHRQVS